MSRVQDGGEMLGGSVVCGSSLEEPKQRTDLRHPLSFASIINGAGVSYYSFIHLLPAFYVIHTRRKAASSSLSRQAGFLFQCSLRPCASWQQSSKHAAVVDLRERA